MAEFPHEDQRNPGVRRARLQDQLQTSLLAFTIVSLVFTGGYNWRRVDELTKRLETVDAEYVRKDVLTEQLRTVTEQMLAVRAQLDDIKATLREQRR